MPLDFTDKFYKEHLENENERVTKWYQKYMDTDLKYALLDEGKATIYETEVIKSCLIQHMPRVTAEHKVNSINCRKKVPLDGPVLGIPESKKNKLCRDLGDCMNPIPAHSEDFSTPMKPVDPEESFILYQNKPERRRAYLKARKRRMPEEKYNYCLTTSQEYGWMLKNSCISSYPSDCCRFNAFENNSIRTRAAVKADPAHYQKEPKYPFFKCPVVPKSAKK